MARLIISTATIFVITLHSVIFPHKLPAVATASSADIEHDEDIDIDIDFPPKLDSDDIAYYATNHDIDGLHWALSNVFRRSVRNTNTSQIVFPNVDPRIIARGGGSTYTTAYKLKVDIEQAEYLSNRPHLDSEEREFFQTVAKKYGEVLKRIPPLEELAKTKGLYPFDKVDYDNGIGKYYNKALYANHGNGQYDELRDGSGNILPLLSPTFDAPSIEEQWYDPNSPPIVVIDDILSQSALSKIRQLLLESTVWYETKMPLEYGGYVGAYIDDGLHHRILLQLAMELNQRLPRIMDGHPLQYLWAYKYDSDYDGIKTHADQAAVNVNLWLTDEGANLDKSSGGLVVYTAKPPDDWDFVRYNTDTDKVRAELLEPTNYHNVTIPYRENRAVIFDSMLFHHTDRFTFRKGYENRRINLTILYGTMQTNQHSQGKESRNNDEL